MLEKVKNTLLATNIPMIAFILYVGKVLANSPTYQDAIVMAILSGVLAYKMKMEPIIENTKFALSRRDEKLNKDVQELKDAFSKINISQVSKPRSRF